MLLKHAVAVILSVLAFTHAFAAPARVRAVVLDFEIIDEMHDPETQTGDRDRLEAITRRLPVALEVCTHLEIVPAPREAVEALAAQIAYVHRCNGCAEDFAKAAGADLVIFTWVQKVSNLIINVNAEVQDASGRTLEVRSVDMRGNTERSWLRAVDALAKRLCEKPR
jgi:hypothetical protein